MITSTIPFLFSAARTGLRQNIAAVARICRIYVSGSSKRLELFACVDGLEVGLQVLSGDFRCQKYGRSLCEQRLDFAVVLALGRKREAGDNFPNLFPAAGGNGGLDLRKLVEDAIGFEWYKFAPQ